ncbi:helix-turn-helix domain-containing protein [Sulfitobacter dubius]|uniref:HTH cro/C1-type domain-containing protein n=1 Tax=Sulfitobacter dubius TaxID=218673 RepID=A0ABY3ZNU6_9RHOB|nr:helix-turn-helix transcriptional regulator [Sulfitobacter dubius]UOA15877.1 hypothetical protein DSM109990_02723 [Sulfitobacter dubius]
MEQQHTVGFLLKQWRNRRRLTQLDLALKAEISQRHLSFLESGRARPSRNMVMLLAEQLDVPLRERNVILNAAGFAPQFSHQPLEAPGLSAAREAIDRILHGHLPHPALAVDRHWNLLSANPAVGFLLTDVAPHLLEGKVNVLRMSLHPEGLAPRILNLGEWSAHILSRLSHQIEVTADCQLVALRDELMVLAFPEPARRKRTAAQVQDIAVPLRLKSAVGPLAFISTTTVFGTAVDVTLSEVTIEAFFPANSDTAAVMAGFAYGQ